MKVQERRDTMIELIKTHGNIGLAELKTHFPDVSEATLRRDLEALDKEQRIIRIHGGAKSVDMLIGTDDLYINRTKRNLEAKQEIARKALSLVQPNLSIFLDSGTTTTEFARVFPDIPCLIYTSGLSCVIEMIDLKAPEMFLIGGKVNKYSYSVSGMRSVECLENLNFNIAIIGSTGYSAERGFSCGSEEESALKRKAMQRAEKVIVLMDSRKIGFSSTYTFARPQEVDIVVTDEGIYPETRAAWALDGVEVL